MNWHIASYIYTAVHNFALLCSEKLKVESDIKNEHVTSTTSIPVSAQRLETVNLQYESASSPQSTFTDQNYDRLETLNLYESVSSPQSTRTYTDQNYDRLETVNLQCESASSPQSTYTDQNYEIISIPAQDRNNHKNNNTAVASMNDPVIIENPAYSTGSGPPLVDNPAYIAVMKASPGTTTAILSHNS